jgi:predicted double-glycine peptidase
MTIGEEARTVSRSSLIRSVSLMLLVPWLACSPGPVNGPVLAADSSGEERANPASVLDQSVRRKTTICGTNALYMLLRSLGRPVTYEQVDSRVNEGRRGASLLELREAAKALGLATRVRRYTMDTLTQCPTPLIAHFKETVNGLATAAGPDEVLAPTGHFVLVLGMDRRAVRLVDGTLGDISDYTWERFPSLWSGYVLEPVEAGETWESWGVVLVSVAWVLVGITVLRPRSTTARLGS